MSPEQTILVGFAGVAVVYFLYVYFTAPATPTPLGGDTTSASSAGLGGFDISNLVGFSQLVQDIAQAISVAEGYGESGAIPTRANNPGDLTDVGQNYPGDTGQRIGQNIIVFDKPSSGFNALYRQINLWLTGQSNVISPDDSIQTLGGKYAPLDSFTWAANVSAQLSAMGYNASVSTPLNQLVKGS